MSGAANHGTYGNPGPGNSPWGPGPIWHQPPWGYWRTVPRPLCVAAVVLGFIFWWPVGLTLLLLSVWSGRMGCWGRYYRQGGYQGAPWQNGAPPWAGWKSWCAGGNERPAASSGNRAFDEYRAETLRRLEDEQKEFAAFLDRLRFAKDKAEFDQFMTEVRQRPPAPPPEQPQPPHGQG
ncbi:MAG TPA: DUF2852 domain-containing protein [Acetobacteraceae bacterium]|nr:DUF2852 domain-containing protein [Acetobacteraceae bacterium]